MYPYTYRHMRWQVKRKKWTWYAVGPGAGIQLSSGRLLVPANHAEFVKEYERPYLPHINRSRMVRSGS